MSLRILRWLPAILIVYLLYFFRLVGVGMLGPDEPRYASIGREMALSGDWITPRLWGQPWFEKPALLYWMTGWGYRLGLGDDLAPRVPVALLSAGFLLFFFMWLRRMFDEQTAFFSTAMLATSAFWVAFSQVGTTDLPLTVWFSVAMLLAAVWLRDGDTRVLPFAGIALGLAILAKGLVPVVLALPLVWAGRKKLKALTVFAIFAGLAAAPWYVPVTVRFGWTFFNEFFLKHHLERFASDALQHVQPWWFYVPVLCGALFPWTPVLALARGRRLFDDAAVRFLASIAAFGFVFFSASRNKLPGYLLPLLPALFVVLALALRRTERPRVALTITALLLVAMPVIASVLPDALAYGLSRGRFTAIDWRICLVFAAVAVPVWRISTRKAVVLLALASCAGTVYLKAKTYPALDATVSARGLWKEVAPVAAETCVESLNRTWRYGLNYYSRQPLPDCTGSGRPVRIVQLPGQPPAVER